MCVIVMKIVIEMCVEVEGMGINVPRTRVARAEERMSVAARVEEGWRW